MDDFNEVSDYIRIASKLDYDELRDVYDLVYHGYAWERYQEEKKDDNPIKEYWRVQSAMCKMRRRGRIAFNKLKLPGGLEPVDELPIEKREVFCSAIKGLIDAKKPVAGQRVGDDGRVATGTFQVKTQVDQVYRRDSKGDFVIDKETGKRVVDDRRKHYLYLRVYHTSHDGTKRTASIYIGSLNRSEPASFISAVTNGDITKEDLVAAFVRGGYDEVKEWRQGMDGLNRFGKPMFFDDFESPHVPSWAMAWSGYA